MNYEHLVQINDPLNPLLETLSVEQVWAGLLLRAEQPQLFVTGLESCTVLSRSGNVFERELCYGPASVRDRVTLTHTDSSGSTRYVVPLGTSLSPGDTVLVSERWF